MKSAQRLAGEIETWILSTHHEPGHFLGNEPELIARFGVSRAVFREAIRIVEFDGLAMMKRGPSGGFFAASPDGDAVTHALSVYLRYRSTAVADLYEARLTVESQCASLAATNVTEADRTQLTRVLREEEEAVDATDFTAFRSCVMNFHSSIAVLSRNGFYALVVKSLLELTEHSSPWPDGQPDGRRDSMAETHHAHVRIGQAVMDGDQALANIRMRRHTRASLAYNQAHADSGTVPSPMH
jgi:DNA-binding FadR family transcriptional regulator